MKSRQQCAFCTLEKRLEAARNRSEVEKKNGQQTLLIRNYANKA